MSHTITVDWPAECIAVINFQDPGRQNQLCWAAIDEMAATVSRCRVEGARIVILASALPGHWYQHAWLGDLQNGLESKPMTGTGQGWFQLQQELAQQPLISIAAVSGDCSGGGAELGWACDFRVAERQARFSQPEIKIGLTTGIGGCSRLSRLVGRAVTAQVVMTGQPLTADRLYQLGAVNEVVEAGRAVDAAITLAESLLENSWSALLSMKRTLATSLELPLQTALEQEQQAFQSELRGEQGAAGIAAIQRRFEQGDSIEDVYKYDKR